MSLKQAKIFSIRRGNTIHISTPEFALAHFKSELVKYAALVKKAGVVPQ